MTTTIEQQPLTDAQASVYAFICAYCREHRYGPTVREIGIHFDWTPHGVVSHLKPLRKKGWITWQDRQARTIQPIGGDA